MRFKVPKPKLPWRYKPRRVGGAYTECGGRIVKRWDHAPTAQEIMAVTAKLCGPRKTFRQFDPGGPESGTLVGARRAPGLFDNGWGEAFPLTRKEQLAYQQGQSVPDPFFAPPTTPHPSNWIEDKLQRLRGTFAPSLFTTPKSMLPFCPKGGSGITCAGPNAEAIWWAEDRLLTDAEKAEFQEAYCKPGVCVTGPKITPPPGVKQRFLFSKPRNPAVAAKASCQPQPQAEPVVMDVPLPPAAPAPPPPAGPPPLPGCPPGWVWTVGLTGCRCFPEWVPLVPRATREDLARCGIVLPS